MNTTLLTLLVLGAGPPADLPACPSGEDQPDVAALIRRHELVQQGNSSEAVMTMTITTKAWTRTLSMKVWSKGEDFALVRVLKGGPREIGMMTLKREKQLWNWLPQAGRVMKLPSGMLGDSWMGSDFTNDDLVRGVSLTRDFESKVTGTVEVDGRKAWKVELTPRAGAVVVWGKVELFIDRQTCVPVEQRFYDEEQALVRRMAFSDVKQIGWRPVATRMTVIPAEPGRSTQVTYDQLEFDADIPDDTFSVHRLQQGK